MSSPFWTSSSLAHLLLLTQHPTGGVGTKSSLVLRAGAACEKHASWLALASTSFVGAWTFLSLAHPFGSQGALLPSPPFVLGASCHALGVAFAVLCHWAVADLPCPHVIAVGLQRV